jgi:hypothetical protein
MSDDAELERHLHGLEEQLMRPATRSSRRKLEELLADDFVEFGSSGAVYDRESVISALLLEQPPAWSIANFEARPLGTDAALVTYTATKGGGASSLRCSVWKRYGKHWKMVFHQGTRIGQ